MISIRSYFCESAGRHRRRILLWREPAAGVFVCIMGIKYIQNYFVMVFLFSLQAHMHRPYSCIHIFIVCFLMLINFRITNCRALKYIRIRYELNRGMYSLGVSASSKIKNKVSKKKSVIQNWGKDPSHTRIWWTWTTTAEELCIHPRNVKVVLGSPVDQIF